MEGKKSFLPYFSFLTEGGHSLILFYKALLVLPFIPTPTSFHVLAWSQTTIPNHNSTSLSSIFRSSRPRPTRSFPIHHPQFLRTIPHKPTQPLGYSLFNHTRPHTTIPCSNAASARRLFPDQSFSVTYDHSLFKPARSHTTIPVHKPDTRLARSSSSLLPVSLMC